MLTVPVVEDVIVKRLLLEEELHSSRTFTLKPAQSDATLRVTHADVQRS